MEPEKVLKFFTENIGDWSRVTLLTLLRPISRFELVPITEDSKHSAIRGVQTDRQLWLHPKLLVFSVVSIMLGLTMNALLPGRASGPDLLASTLIIFLFWVVCASFLHLLCRLLKGKGQYLETLSVTLQVSATLYVISSFLALLLAALTAIPEVKSKIDVEPFLGEDIGDFPVYLFFATSTIFTAIYVPLALKSVHRFGWFRASLISLILVMSVVVPISIYKIFGLLTGAVSVAP